MRRDQEHKRKVTFFFFSFLTLKLRWTFWTLWQILHLTQVEVNQQVTHHLLVTAFRHFILWKRLSAAFPRARAESVSVPPKLLHLCWIWLVLRVGGWVGGFFLRCLLRLTEKVRVVLATSQQQTQPTPDQKENTSTLVDGCYLNKPYQWQQFELKSH